MNLKNTNPTTTRPSKTILFAYIATGIAIGFMIAFTIYTYTRSPQVFEFNSTMFPGPLPVDDFTLTTGGDQPVSLSDYRGQYVLVYFGFTACPDVCPTTLSILDDVMEILGDDAQQTQVLVISIDPERDSPDKMTRYATTFNPDFVGLSGDLEQISLVAGNFNIHFEKEYLDSAIGYTMAHTSSIQLVGPDGQRIGSIPFSLTAEEIASDLQQLLK